MSRVFFTFSLSDIRAARGQKNPLYKAGLAGYLRGVASCLKRKLKPYGLDKAPKLAAALGVHRQYAYQLLRGDTFGPRTAAKIGRVIGISWAEVYGWRDGK